jgi:membrane protein
MPSATETGYEPKTGLGATFKRLFREFKEDNLTDWAAALTYYGVLSLFPALIALTAIVGLVLEPAQVTKAITTTVQQVSPGSAAKTFAGPIESVTKSKSGSLVALIIGTLIAVNAASNYVGAFMRASNVIYEVDEGRPFWKMKPIQIGITLVMLILLSIAAVLVVVSGPLASAVGKGLGVGSAAVTAWDIAKWPVLALIVILMLAVLFYASPNAKLPGFKWVTLGSVFTVVVVLVASALFALYVANFGSYNKTYGSLGGVIVFLVWLWISNVGILLGHELNAERERDRELQRGEPGAEEALQLEERDPAKEKERPTTA